MTYTDPELVTRLRGIGCPYPIRLITEAHRTGLSIALGASMVVQESSWENIFGHDETIFAGAGPVTEVAYHAYSSLSERTGEVQGVGVTQLTYRGYQLEADKLGGCWIIACQLQIGFGILAEHVRSEGLHAGVAAYNGSGPAAEAYADEVIARAVTFAKELHLPAP